MRGGQEGRSGGWRRARGNRTVGALQSSLTHGFSPHSVACSKPVGPASEASRTVRSFSLYTKSCIFPLLLTAEGASPLTLLAHLASQVDLSSLRCMAHAWVHYSVSSLFSHPLAPQFSLTTLIQLRNTQRGKKWRRVISNSVRPLVRRTDHR